MLFVYTTDIHITNQKCDALELKFVLKYKDKSVIFQYKRPNMWEKNKVKIVQNNSQLQVPKIYLKFE
jgi:hypothetical protein